MNPLIAHRLLTGEGLRDPERDELLQIARRLRAEASAGHPAMPLAGRHVAIMASRPDSPSSSLFEEAAGGLGAHVSHINPLAQALERAQAGTARLIGSLYDAVECEGLPAEAALTLERLGDLPTFRGLGDDWHPIRQLLPALKDQGGTGDDSEREQLIRLIQAVLLDCIR